MRVKSFIFSHEPNEWAFGVPESLRGEKQTIDITDDFTGEPSEIAKSNILMYVNEVGHDKSLKQTVHAFDKDDRTVQYYLDIKDRMKAGESIEVFVNYFDAYEEIRRRKGYGKRNLAGLEKSDKDFPTRMRRNFEERETVEWTVRDLTLVQLYELTEWLGPIWSELARKVDLLPQREHTANHPTVLQLIALRRLEWLSSLLEQRHKELQGQNQYVSAQIASSLKTMKYKSWGPLYTLLSASPTWQDSRGVKFEEEAQREIVEELCYGVRDKIPKPLDRSLWCDIATTLTMILCNAIAESLWCNCNDALEERFMEAATGAAKHIQYPKELWRLAFDSNFSGECGLTESQLEDAAKKYMLGNDVLVVGFK